MRSFSKLESVPGGKSSKEVSEEGALERYFQKLRQSKRRGSAFKVSEGMVLSGTRGSWSLKWPPLEGEEVAGKTTQTGRLLVLKVIAQMIVPLISENQESILQKKVDITKNKY